MGAEECELLRDLEGVSRSCGTLPREGIKANHSNRSSAFGQPTKSLLLGSESPVIRIPHILISMGLILLAGVLGAKHLEDRMGVSAVPGLVLLDCPELGASSLERLGARWQGATLERVPAETGFFHPFGPEFVRRRVLEGDATALFSAGPADRNDVGVANWSVILDGFPGPERDQRAEEAAAAVVSFMGQRSGSRPFLAGLALEPGLTEQTLSQIVNQLLQAAHAYPGSRRTALVILGALSPDGGTGRLARRWCLRIPVGDWRHLQQAGLRDLLEAGRPSVSKEI